MRVKQTSRQTLPTGYLRGWDACCVIGGDGTLLGVAREAAQAKVPIIGVNRVGLGFLTTFSPDEARDQFPALLRGAFHLDHRALLKCLLHRRRARRTSRSTTCWSRRRRIRG